MENNKKFVTPFRTVTFKQELVDNNIELSVRHLKQFFKFGHGASSFKTKAVHDVSFDIKKGECFGLVGESGCGKTTTGRSILRLYNITSGSVYFEGYRIAAGKRWNQKEIKWTTVRGNRKIKELHSAQISCRQKTRLLEQAAALKIETFFVGLTHTEALSWKRSAAVDCFKE